MCIVVSEGVPSSLIALYLLSCYSLLETTAWHSCHLYIYKQMKAQLIKWNPDHFLSNVICIAKGGIYLFQGRQLKCYAIFNWFKFYFRVHDKPYVELKDSDGRSDQIVAEEVDNFPCITVDKNPIWCYSAIQYIFVAPKSSGNMLSGEWKQNTFSNNQISLETKSMVASNAVEFISLCVVSLLYVRATMHIKTVTRNKCTDTLVYYRKSNTPLGCTWDTEVVGRGSAWLLHSRFIGSLWLAHVKQLHEHSHQNHTRCAMHQNHM